MYLGKRKKPTIEALQTEAVPTYSQATATPVSTAQISDAPKEPRDRIFYWYRLVARLLATITRTLLGPQKTLREFARESSENLGAASKYFIELTGMVERLLYSRHNPTEADAEKSKKLSNDVAEGLKGEGI